MLCPKCKKEIENNSLKCTQCGAKIGSLCTDCGTYNLITAKECKKCKKTLLKICNQCGAANLPSSEVCRKCGNKFINESNNLQDKLQPAYHATMNSQQKIKAKLIEGIKDPDFKIISICGESGCGKNLVLRSAISELQSAKLIWLMGSCTQITQLSPFGFFQDLLLTFFNINNFCPDTLQLKKNSLKFFKQDFPLLNNNEILDLLNFLYPENVDKYENIYFNKVKMFSIMKKVILTIVEKMKVIFIIDNFEYIDGMSYDFIKELLKEDLINTRSKFIILSSEIKPGLGRITTINLKPENYLDLTIAPFSETQIEIFLKQYNDYAFSKDFAKITTKVSNGNPSIVEQIVLLNADIRRNQMTSPIYKSINEVMIHRLDILRKENTKAYRLLAAMSILGVKFYPAILDTFDNNTYTEFEQLIENLVQLGYITQLNNLAFEFKSSDIWKACVSVFKNDNDFEEILNIIYDILSRYKQSSLALLGYIVQKLNNNDQAFDTWTLLMKHASYIGDIGLYIITQKQSLKLIENKVSEFYTNVKRNIYTRLGKLLEPIDHTASYEYLYNAIMMLGDDDDAEHIELLGYIASCAMKAGNYCGAIECIDNVLNKISDAPSFDKTLVKSRLVTPLLRLGNYGQLINLVETEILPEIEKILKRGKNTPLIKSENLFELWLQIYFDYTEAVIFQGDNKGFDLLQNIYETLDTNKITDTTLTCKADLLLALANTVKGDFKTSSKILDDILKSHTLDNMDSFIVSRWNFIDILNKFFNKEYTTLHTELFNVASYANNINDSFTKNILKTILAKILKDNNQTKKALEILEEQVSYFAKEKVATGVLLSWYLIAKIKLITSGTQFALDIATKALDVAQGPNINNYYFISLFNKLIGEIYLAKQDFDSARVYTEKSIFISKQFDLQYILVKNYLQAARLYQELALPKSSNRGEYIKNALQMFKLAKNVSIVAEQKSIQKIIKDELNILTSFCKLNGITLKKDTK